MGHRAQRKTVNSRQRAALCTRHNGEGNDAKIRGHGDAERRLEIREKRVIGCLFRITYNL